MQEHRGLFVISFRLLQIRKMSNRRLIHRAVNLKKLEIYQTGERLKT